MDIKSTFLHLPVSYKELLSLPVSLFASQKRYYPYKWCPVWGLQKSFLASGSSISTIDQEKMILTHEWLTEGGRELTVRLFAKFRIWGGLDFVIFRPIFSWLDLAFGNDGNRTLEQGIVAWTFFWCWILNMNVSLELFWCWILNMNVSLELFWWWI